MSDSWLRQARTWRALTASGARLRTLAAGSRVVSVLAPPVRRLSGAVTGDGDQPGESGETAIAEALSSPAVSGSHLLGWLGRARRYVHLARASGANTLCAGQTAFALGVTTLWHT